MGDYLLGLITGVWIMLFLHLYETESYKRTLVFNAKKRSAEHIKGEFYYIVPEKEYIKSDLNRRDYNE